MTRNFVTQGLMLGLLAVPVAASAQASKAADSPGAAVEEFIRAVADSNLTRMSQLWGTSKGPAFLTHQPSDYEKRMLTTQLFLHGAQAHALGSLPGTKSGTRVVTTQLVHNGCKVTIPFTTVHAKEGWIVEGFDLAQAGQVNHPCDARNGTGNGGP